MQRKFWTSNIREKGKPWEKSQTSWSWGQFFSSPWLSGYFLEMFCFTFFPVPCFQPALVQPVSGQERVGWKYEALALSVPHTHYVVWVSVGWFEGWLGSTLALEAQVVQRGSTWLNWITWQILFKPWLHMLHVITYHSTHFYGKKMVNLGCHVMRPGGRQHWQVAFEEDQKYKAAIISNRRCHGYFNQCYITITFSKQPFWWWVYSQHNDEWEYHQMMTGIIANNDDGPMMGVYNQHDPTCVVGVFSSTDRVFHSIWYRMIWMMEILVWNILKQLNWNIKLHRTCWNFLGPTLSMSVIIPAVLVRVWSLSCRVTVWNHNCFFVVKK